MQLITYIIILGIALTDKRGTHSNRVNKINPQIWVYFDNFIKTFSIHQSHYNYETSSKYYFVNTSLNYIKLYKKFLSFLNEKSDIDIKLSFIKFFYYFKEKYNYGFKNPRNDICDLCFESSQTGINNLDEKTRDSYNTYLNKYETYKEYKNELVKCDSVTLVIEIDYCKTHPIPKLPNNSLYYSKVRNFNLLNAHIYNRNKSFMYYFLEGEFKKG